MSERRVVGAVSTAVIMVCAPLLAQRTFHRGEGQLLPPAIAGEDSPLSAMVDLTQVDYLWAFQREALAPPAAHVGVAAGDRARVVAALLAASRSPDDELRWQALWALARIGRHDAAVAGQVRRRLADRTAPGGAMLEDGGAVGDVACVALGLVAHGDRDALQQLVAIAGGAGGASARRRACAFYGLGLAADNSRVEAVQFRVLSAVERSLLAASEAPDEVRIAALHALAMVHVDVAPKLPGPVDQLLVRAWQEPSPVREGGLDFRAHVPVAVASVVPSDSELAEAWRERFGAVGHRGGASRSVGRSAVLALGHMSRPWRTDASPDAATGELLHDLSRRAKDQQTLYFALFALGCMGGESGEAALQEALAGSFLIRPWAAFGLAVAARRNPAGVPAHVEALEALVARTRNPAVLRDLQHALAVMRHVLEGHDGQDAAGDAVRTFELRYGGKPPAPLVTSDLVDALADEAAGLQVRRDAAMLLGHLADGASPHWSARLASAIDYRSGTQALLGWPHGVLRLP